jgi:hypothetical protein
VTFDRHEPTLDLGVLANLGGFDGIDAISELGDEMLEEVSCGLRDPSIFVVDPANAPDGWDERLTWFVGDMRHEAEGGCEGCGGKCVDCDGECGGPMISFPGGKA